MLQLFPQLAVFKLKLKQVVDLPTSSDTWTDTHLYPGGQYFFAVSGSSQLSCPRHVCVYVCLFAWLACQDIWLHLSPMEDYRKWQIKGLSLAAWQRTENYSRSRRCARMCVRANTRRRCLRACANPPRRRLIPPATKPITAVIPPKTCPVFDAHH